MAGRENEDGHRRHPRNLQGLLDFCTDVTAQEDTTRNSSMVELSQERREFLENAIAVMQGDVAKCMANLIQILQDPCVFDENSNVSKQDEALENLADYAEDIDNANDLHKMNAFPIIVNILDSPHTTLQIGAAQLIGDICQNNEICQQNMLPLHTMEKLLYIIDSHNDPDCKVKALFALSCLTREFEPAEKLFARLSGFCYLMRAIQTKVPKLIVKSIFLLNYFIDKTDKHKDTLLSMGFIDQLVSVLFSDTVEDTSREYCTLILLNLSSSYDKALQECLRPEFNLVQQLKDRSRQITNKEEYQDEEKHINSLLKLLAESEEKEEATIR